MSNMRDLLNLVNELSENVDEGYVELHDSFDIELNDDFIIETGVIGFVEDGIVLEGDDHILELLEVNDVILESTELDERMIMGVSTDASVGGDKVQGEAKYQGREVPLGKPMKGDVKKSKVYVKGPKGNVVKVNFGDKKMKIKKSNPKRRKSFRARHRCENPGPRWKARYWSCRAW
jgi:hypothetical protein